MKKNIKKYISSYYRDLSTSEKKIADFILSNQALAAKASIQELSQKTGLSTATISRFSKRLGYSSFQEFKIALNMSQATDYNELLDNLSSKDDILTISKKVFRANKQALTDTESFLDQEILNKAFTFLKKAKTVTFFGLGASQIVALDAYHKFLRTTLQCNFQSDYHMQLMAAAKLDKNDCGIIISHSGRNTEMMRIGQILSDNNVPIICITSHIDSPLAKLANITLLSVAEETNYRPETMSAMIAQLSIVDCLFMIYSMADNKLNKVIREQVREVIQDTRAIEQ
ncbi:MurR/RpiR family transcriptional regulator [Vagococcus sp.]|uniref:MurR/RpiR family transcriptional regulator n=1 Tax=Vagococcus sp. TaxID=1933889 RepID=UPI003F98F5E7